MRKSRITAAILAIFFGGVGVHKFYLKKPTHGIMYIVLNIFAFRILGFPIAQVLGFIDAFKLFFMSDQAFDQTYNTDVQEWQSNSRDRRGRSQNTRRNQRRTTDQRRTDRRQPSRSSRHNRNTTPKSRFEREHARRRPSKKSYPKSNPYKQSGIRKFKDYDIKGAIEDFTKALSSSPNDASLHFNLACSYSLNEEENKSFHHLSKAVSNGFKDFEKISTHEALAYLRIQDGFDEFVERGYKSSRNEKTIAPPAADSSNLLDEDVLLKQLNKLGELRQKGLLTEEEFMEQRRRLMD